MKAAVPSQPRKKARDLLAFLCEDPSHEAAGKIAGWIGESQGFHDFAHSNRAKIRKKLRTVTTPEGLRSVLLELDVARHFVADRRCLVDYERFGQGRVRSSDLTVTFRTHTSMNVEVTLVREPRGELPAWDGKLIGLVCHKLGQMMPDEVNLLVLASEEGTLTIEDVARGMKTLKERAERREADLLSRIGFASPSSFFKEFQRLSGILVWPSAEGGAARGRELWTNPQAKRPLPAGMAALLTAGVP